MRRFPSPWTVEKIPGGFKVIDSTGQSLAYVYGHADLGGILGETPGVLLDWRHCGVDLVVILHHEIDIGREFHGLRGRFQF